MKVARVIYVTNTNGSTTSSWDITESHHFSKKRLCLFITTKKVNRKITKNPVILTTKKYKMKRNKSPQKNN